MKQEASFLQLANQLWPQLLSDATIFLAYAVIAIGLVYFVKKRGVKKPFKWLVYSSIVFLTLCALVHLSTLLPFWSPSSNFKIILHITTALVSLATVFLFLKALPAFIKLENPSALRIEIDEKNHALKKANKSLESQVKERTKRMQEAQAIADLGFWEMDTATQTSIWSEELYRIFGLDASTFKPSYKSYLALLPSSEREKITNAVKQSMQTKKRFDVVHQYLHPDGSVRYLRARGKAVTNQSVVTKLIGTVQDITKEKLIQDAIIENELMMRSFLKSATDAIVVCNQQGQVLKWNKAAERIFGWTEKEMFLQSVNLLIAKNDDLQNTVPLQEHVLNNNPSFVGDALEIECLKKDGTHFPVELALGRWEIDNQLYFCCIMRDISSRKKAENELLELKNELEKRVEERTAELYSTNEKLEKEIAETAKIRQEVTRLATIVQESDDSILSMELDGTITSWNSGATRLYGFTAKEAIGQNLHQFCTQDGQTEIANILHRIRQGVSIENYETARITKDGRIVPISISYSPLRNKAGEIVGISGIARNITQQKKAEKEQKRLIKKLEATNKELESFAYVTSHDLKAPLRAIGSLADWIYADYANVLGEEGKKHLQLLKSRVQRMHDLIEGILQYSRVGRKDGERVTTNLNKVVNDVLKFIEIPDHVTISVPNKLPTVCMPKTQPTQLFENLISNAIKYGNPKNAKIHIDVKECAEFWQFSVADNGPGIDPKFQQKVFEIFQTLRSRDEVESTGIGLTIVKKIIENAGGEIWIESELGKGTTFFFTLPKS